MNIMKVGNYSFVGDSELEKWRIKTLFTKEKGTVKWLEGEVKPGDIIYDIGANIGLYTIVAAHLTGPGGIVYAFEPHMMNAVSLLRNVEVNNFTDRVKIFTCALHAKEGFLPFNYISTKTGSSGHQLGHTTSESGKQFTPELVELKYSTTIDKLIADNIIKPANLIKMDVDGNEKLILRGMSNLLNVSSPRNIQVEIHPSIKKGIFAFMKEHGYPLSEAGRHDTMHGKELIFQGIDPENVAYNIIFRKKK